MKRLILIALLVATACGRERVERTSTATSSARTATSSGAVAVPDERTDARDAAALEQQRFDEQWRQLQSFKAQQAAQQAQQQQAQQAAQIAAQQAQQQAATQAAAVNIEFVQAKKQTFKGLDASAINSAPVSIPIKGDMSGPSVLKTQVFLDRNHFSVGSLDGRWGKNSAIAVWWWQRSHNLPPTGDVDEATFRSLVGAAGTDGSGMVPAVVSYQVTADDLKGPFVQIPSDVYEKAKLDCLCYESVKEELAEKFHTTQDFLGLLNPDVSWGQVQAGQSLNVPNVRTPLTANQNDIASAVISVKGNTFNAFDSAGNLIFHAPTTLGSKYDPSPDETVTVMSIAHNPDFRYQPTLFHEVPDSDPEAELKPGPNSPVGVVWMALSKEHFGIHGTSDPDSIGYASSHGCIRLTNWDADEVSHRISKGVKVSFVDTKKEDTSTAAK